MPTDTQRAPWPRHPQSVEELLEAADAADEAAGLVVFNRTDAGRTLKAATKEKLIERLALTGADHGTCVSAPWAPFVPPSEPDLNRRAAAVGASFGPPPQT